jgi:glutathione S-transferase
MTLRLFYAPGACSFVPHAALETIAAATGEQFEFQSIRLHKGEHRTPEYLAMNPDGQVPVITVDGKPLTQILAICGYLDARFPSAGLLPADPWARAQALSLLAWMNNSVHPTFTHFFMPQKFTDDADSQAKIRAAAVPAYRAHLERIQGWIECAQPWLSTGEQPSFLDFYALTLFRWGGYAGIDPATLPVLRAYVNRVAGASAVAAAMAREKIELDVYKPAAA